MKKLFLFLLIASAGVAFFFLSPIFATILGLCVVLLGLVSIFKPTMVSSKKFRYLGWVRLLGCFVLVLGIMIAYAGADLSYRTYADSGKSHHLLGDDSDVFNTVGTVIARPRYTFSHLHFTKEKELFSKIKRTLHHKKVVTEPIHHKPAPK